MQLEKLRGEYEVLKQEHEKTIVSFSSEVAHKQKQNDKFIDASKQREEWYIVEKEVSREEVCDSHAVRCIFLCTYTVHNLHPSQEPYDALL